MSILDPYEAIRQAYLVGTDTESEPFEDLGTESPESPHIVASPISFRDSTPPVGHVEELEGSSTSSGGSTSLDSTTPLSPDHPLTSSMSDVAFHKRFRSSYEGSPSLSPTLPVRKRYRGTSEIILGTDCKGDELGDEEVSLDSDSGSKDAEDEGPVIGDEDPSLDDEGYGFNDESHGIDDEGHSVERDGLGLEEEDEAVPEGQQQAAPVVETTVGEPLGLGYGALRRRELAVEEDQRYSMFEVGQGSGSAPEPERSERVSAFRQPALTTWTDPKDSTVYIDVPTYPPSAPPVQTPPSPDWTPVATPTATILVDEDQFIQDEIFSQRYQLKSLEQEQERDVMTFRALWRPVLALETWAGHVDTRMANMSRAGYDDHRLVHDLLVHQTSLQHELQEMRGRVTALEQERDRGEQ
ncbi:hypothetical protein Tco_1198101 [Tanacetum coccineum]